MSGSNSSFNWLGLLSEVFGLYQKYKPEVNAIAAIAVPLISGVAPGAAPAAEAAKEGIDIAEKVIDDTAGNANPNS